MEEEDKEGRREGEEDGAIGREAEEEQGRRKGEAVRVEANFIDEEGRKDEDE